MRLSSSRRHTPPTVIISKPHMLIITALLVSSCLAQRQQQELSHSEPIPLDYDYSHDSLKGPSNWKFVETDVNEWNHYIGHEEINLDVAGNECHSTRRPSPVNLVANSECEDTHEILTRQIQETDCRIEHLEFSITPHVLRADFPFDDSTCERPKVDLPNGYPFWWLAHHIEVHIRAEHVVDGRRYDGEIQMFHLGQEDQKRELSSVSVLLDASAWEDEPRLQEYIERWEAVAKQNEEACQQASAKKNAGDDGRRRRLLKQVHGKKHEGSSDLVLESNYTKLTFRKKGRGKQHDDDQHYTEDTDKQTTNTQESKEHGKTALKENTLHPDDHRRRLSSLFENNPTNNNKRNERRTNSITTSTSNFVPRDRMFPYNIWPTIYFYRYRGMLTAPPCSEIVSWRILDEPLLISRHQLQRLAALLRMGDSKTCWSDAGGRTRTSESGENVRPLQRVSQDRQILVHCTEKDFGFQLYSRNKA